VRSGPGTNYGIIGEIPYGQRYVAIAESGGWYKIYFKGNTGWIYGGYTVASSGSAAKVNVSVLNVRSGPSTGYAIIGEVHSPEMYVIEGSSGSWWKVNWGGTQGWIHGGYTTTMTIN
jgi:N-acetylmuramoyl-L-alanine amidase